MRMQEIAKKYKERQKALKDKDINYIKSFSNISVKNVCEDLKIAYPNVMAGTTSYDNIHKVKNEIERRIKIISGE